MFKKLAKLKYLPNKFEIISEGDHVICAVSNKKIALNDLTYWNVELQEPTFLTKKLVKKENKKTSFISIYCATKSTDQDF